MKAVLSAKDLADELAVAESTARSLFTAGRLPGGRVGGRWLITKRALLAWLHLVACEPMTPGITDAERERQACREVRRLLKLDPFQGEAILTRERP